MKKNNGLTKEQLEKIKLIAEIKTLNKSILSQPAFWTFIAVVITACIGFYTGLFQSQKALIELENKELNLKKDNLHIVIDSLDHQYRILQNEHDSLYFVVYGMQKEQDSIKYAYKIWKQKKQSKKELKDEVLKFTGTVRAFLLEQNKESISNMFKGRQINDNLPQRSKDSLWEIRTIEMINRSNYYMDIYNKNYKTNAIIYREKLAEYLPNHKTEYYFHYTNPVNPLGIEDVVDDLEYMANKLEQ